MKGGWAAVAVEWAPAAVHELVYAAGRQAVRWPLDAVTAPAGGADVEAVTRALENSCSRRVAEAREEKAECVCQLGEQEKKVQIAVTLTVALPGWIAVAALACRGQGRQARAAPRLRRNADSSGSSPNGRPELEAA